jgi:hypothetical protein
MDKKPASNSAVLDDLPPTHRPLKGEGDFGPLRMDFPAAAAELLRGKRITRLAWNAPNIYVVVGDEFLLIHKGDGKIHQILLSMGDLFADDWVVVQ